MTEHDFDRIPERDALLQAARGIAPTVEAGAEASERAGTLERATVDALCGAGVFRTLVPRVLGGFEADPWTAVEVVEEVARQDGAAGWCAGIAIVSNALMSANLSDTAVERVFGAVDNAIVAGGFVPSGKAVPVGDGFRVSGRFRFGSGCRHATWIAATCPMPDDEGRPRMRAFCIEPARVEIHDNWQSAGLEGTASCDYSVYDEVIDAGYSFVVGDPPKRGGAVYRLPLLSIAYVNHTGFALGIGRRALEEIVGDGSGRVRLGSAAAIAERGAVQSELARHDARMRGARLLAERAFGALWEAQRAGEGATLELRAGVAQAAVHAATTASEVAAFALRCGGAGSLFRSQRVQRLFRDMHAALQHIAVSDEVWERVGQIRLGLGRDPMFV